MQKQLINTTLFMDAICKYAETQPDHLACVFQPRAIDTAQRLSYQQLYQQIEARSQLMVSLGYHNKVVALLYPSGLDFVINFLACLNCGVIAVPLNVTRNAKQLERTIDIIEDANVCAILTTEDTKAQLCDQLQEIVDGRKHNFAWLTERNETALSQNLPVVKASDIAFIQYTSGSTSTPKGVMVSHSNIVDNMKAIETSCGLQKGVVLGGWLPQFHDMGLIGHMLSPLYLGGTYIFMPPMNFIQRPSRWLQLISHYRIFCSAAPNFGYEHCVKLISDREDLTDLDLSCWKVALNGSEPVSAKTMAAFAQKFAPYGFNVQSFFPSYGMAETTLLVSGGPLQSGISVLNLDKNSLSKGLVTQVEVGVDIVCCGEISAHFSLKIVDPDTLQECSKNQVGEIWLSGDSVAQGYLNNPARTKADFQATLASDNAKQYLRTGDLGFVVNNQLYVTGRIKEVLIIRGRNLYPYDIERTCNSYPYANGGNGASVFTYQCGAETKLGAIVEINKRFLATIDKQVMTQDINALVFAQHEISFDKLLVTRPGTIPKTTSGKVKRAACATLI